MLRADGHAAVTFHGAPGDYVSIVPVTDRVSGITSSGLRWPLLDVEMERGASEVVSNELGPTVGGGKTGEPPSAWGGFRIGGGVAFAAHTFRAEALPPGWRP